MKSIKVYFAYGWTKGSDALSDKRWTSIFQYFKKTNEEVAAKCGVPVSFARLRASHGRPIWESILEKIESSDVVILDVATAPRVSDINSKKKLPPSFNANVLVELGAALALRKRVLILCPEELHKKGRFPSDVSSCLLTLYRDWQKGADRTFCDPRGVLPQYKSMLHQVVEERTENEECVK